MPVETRYLRSDTWTVNGLTAYRLGIEQSGEWYARHESLIPDAPTVYWGIRVWKRTSGGAETEITAGTPVAVVQRSADGEGLQSATWDCPSTPLDAGDAIIVHNYVKIGTGAWQDWTAGSLIYITEPLGGNQLNSATWTVYYYTDWAYSSKDDTVSCGIFFGTSVYNSRIENFSWTYVPVIWGGDTHQVQMAKATLEL